MPRSFRDIGGRPAVSPMVLDRRSRNRKPNPPCPTCRAEPEHVHGTVRSSFRIFFKCDRCGGVWDTEIPRRTTGRR
jgi:transposase-like protein